jgi:hypothetical protein
MSLRKDNTCQQSFLCGARATSTGIVLSTREEFGRYAASVVTYEKQPISPSRRIALFATEHEGGDATRLFTGKSCNRFAVSPATARSARE